MKRLKKLKKDYRRFIVPNGEYRDISADTTLDNANTTKAAERIPPMQEDSPDYWLIKDPDQDDPFFVSSKDALDIHLNAGYKVEAKLYTRPDNKLRKAAKEAVKKLDSIYPFLPEWLIDLRNDLHAALEEK